MSENKGKLDQRTRQGSSAPMSSELFFSVKNAEMLYKLTLTYIKKQTNYTIGKNEREALVEVMNICYSKYPKEQINSLNKRVLDILLPMIMKHVDDITNPKTVDRAIYTTPKNEDTANIIKRYEQENATRIPKMNEPSGFETSIDNSSYDNPEILYDKILTERKHFDTELPQILQPDEAGIISTQQRVIKPQDIQQHIISDSRASSTFVGQASDSPPQPEYLQLHIPRPKEFEQIEKDMANDLYKRETILVIDSRDRNTDIYPNPNEYEIDLLMPLNDVVSIELLTAEIPHSGYVINDSNNIIHFQETYQQEVNEIILGATIPHGNYTPTTLKTAIETSLNNTSVNGANHTVSFNTSTNKVTITSDLGGTSDRFNLIFLGITEPYQNSQYRTLYKDNSIGSVLGFDRRIYSGTTGTTSYTGDFQYDLSGEKYILLKIRDIEAIDGMNNIQNAFAKISLDSTLSTTKFFKLYNEYKVFKKLNPPINRLTSLKIRFETYDGQLYNFGGREHSLTFNVCTYGQHRNYFH